MTRKPRSKEDHLVTVKLFVQGYGFKGFINYFSCQLAWFVVMNDFGFPPFQLLFTNGIKIYPSSDSDFYNPTSPYFGNSQLAAAGYTSCDQYNSNA
jgi:sodium/potassium-transporting ATPase subunit alpha